MAAWREANGAQADLDFAYYFDSFHEASAEAGSAVAGAWRACFTRVSQGLQGMVRDIVAKDPAAHLLDPMPAPPAPKPARAAPKTSPIVALSQKTQIRLPAKRPKLSTAPAPSSLEQENEQFRATLLDILQDASRFRVLRADPEREQKVKSFESLVSGLLGATETPTLKRVQLTWAELYRHVELGQLGHPLQPWDLELFVRSNSAPQRVMQAFLWMQRNLHLDWDFSLCRMKRKRQGNRYGVGAKQAPTAEMTMFVELERVLQSAAEHSSSRWLALFGAWCQVLGAVRYQHLQRSILWKVTSQTCFFICTRGKQKHSRDGFHWSVPSHLVTTGYPLGEKLAQTWRRWTTDNSSHVGLVAHPSNREHVNAAAATACIQSIMVRVLGNDAGRVTSKSWRQFGITMVVRAGFSTTDQVAFGNWLDRAPGGNTSIPMRYCGSKLEQSTFLRHVVWAMIRNLQHEALTWSQITNTQLEAARNLAMDDVATFLDQVATTFMEFEAPKVAAVLRAAPFKLMTKFAKKAKLAVAEVVHPPGEVVDLTGNGPQQVEQPSQVSGRLPVASQPSVSHATPKPAVRRPAMEHTLDDDYFDRLAAQRWRRPGHADRPEPPTVIWRRGPAGPHLILGGILTAEQAEELETMSVGLVINCLAPRDTRGVMPAAAVNQRFPVGRQERGKHWSTIRRQVGQALAAQESVYVHCAAGVHRAPIGAGAILSCIEQVEPEEALTRIARVRSVEPEKALKDTAMRRWLFEEAELTPLPGLVVKLPVQFVASQRAKSLFHVVPEGMSEDEPVPACRWRRSAATARSFAGGRDKVHLANSVHEAAAYGLSFCTQCAWMLPPSYQQTLEDVGATYKTKDNS